MAIKDFSKCEDAGDCYGVMVGPIKPLVFSFDPAKAKVMVITEQPLDKRMTKEDLKRSMRDDKRGVPCFLRELLGNAFCDSVQTEAGAFYWTHYIKCPGNIRNRENKIRCKKEHGKKWDDDACANTHLKEEINTLRPRLIVSIGAENSRWILKNTGRKDEDWREYVWEEIAKKEELKRFKIGDVDTSVFFLIHPAERSGLGKFIDLKLKPLLEREIAKYISE